MKLKEDEFYKMLDIVEKFEGPVDDTVFFPTIEDMEKYNVKNNIKKYLPMLFFFAGNPYKDKNIANKEEYEKSVEYINKMIAQIELK